MSSPSSKEHPEVHRLYGRGNSTKSISDLAMPEGEEKQQSRRRNNSSDSRRRRYRNRLESNRSSSTGDLSMNIEKSSSRSLGKHESGSLQISNSPRRSSSSDRFRADPSSPSKKRRNSSHLGQKFHGSSSTGGSSIERHSSSRSLLSSPSNNRRKRRRDSSQRSAKSMNNLFEEEEVPVKFGHSNIRQIHQHSSNSPNRSTRSMKNLFEQEEEEEDEVSVKFGYSNFRQIHQHCSSSLSDLSVSGTDSDGIDFEDLEGFFNSSGADWRMIADDEEFFNSSGGDLGMIAEDEPLDGRRFEIEFCFNDNTKGRDILGPKQNSKRSMSSVVTVEERLRVDEAFMSYTLAEKAALQIQRKFRRKKQMERERQEDAGAQKDECDADEEKGSAVLENDSESQSGNKDWYALILFAILGAAQGIFTLIGCFWKGNNVDAPPIDTTVNTFGGGGGGGGGGGAAPPPPGLEAMAGQAAASAGSSVGTGAAAGASAGAAAGATSAGAAAAASGAATATATSQVVTAVAVTSAVATAASTTGILTPMDVAEPLIVSRCGLVSPEVRVGKFAMVFEGFSRTLDGRESLLLEGLVLDAYNNLTIGEDLNATGTCLDPLSREMQDVKIENQTYVPLPEGSAFLEVMFETSIVCDKCSPSRPLFKNEKEKEIVEADGKQEANDDIDDAQHLVNGDEDESPAPKENATRLLRRKQNKRRLEDQGQLLQDQLQDQVAAFDESGAGFFHRLIQKVVFETEELSKDGELPEGFVTVAQAYVTPTPIENGAMDRNEVTANNDSSELEDALITNVKYQKQDGKGAFEFSYVDEDSGSRVTEVVVSDPADIVLNPIPSTPFPTFGPTREPSISPTGIPFSGQPTFLPSAAPTDLPSPVPTDSPSTHPTIIFSGQPTFEPSSNPSAIPSEIPTDAPSASPSISPSDVPSHIPSVFPSSVPSIVPTDAPSVAPSESPSDVPSVVPSESPSMVPSVVPSDVPSLNPSSQPSDVPSNNPSSQPSDAPSDNPSSSPSMVPSDVPSISMVPSASPSDVPSSNPSESPSNVPSTVPSESPSATPSMVPSMVPSDLPTVSIAPSAKPSASPSDSPTVSFAPTVSAAPTGVPTISMSPSESPSASDPTTSPAPSTLDRYWTVCGRTSCGHTASLENQNNDRIGGTGLEIAVRCCADTALSGFTQSSTTCPWVESYIGGTCYYRATFKEAEDLCAGVQARLCTKDELERDCTANSGCQHNHNVVWSSTPE